MKRQHRNLQRSYTLLAPFYDFVIRRALEPARRTSLARISSNRPLTVLVNGIGTGLDLPWLRPPHRYIGTDLTRAMLTRAAGVRHALDLQLVQADSESLPFQDHSFDIVVMHLILAIVSDPVAALREVGRVLRRGGSVFVLDKFLKQGQRAPLRRALSPLAGRIATHLDVELGPVLMQVPSLALLSDEPAFARGWFRRLELRKTN